MTPASQLVFPDSPRLLYVSNSVHSPRAVLGGPRARTFSTGRPCKLVMDHRLPRGCYSTWTILRHLFYGVGFCLFPASNSGRGQRINCDSFGNSTMTNSSDYSERHHHQAKQCSVTRTWNSSGSRLILGSNITTLLRALPLTQVPSDAQTPVYGACRRSNGRSGGGIAWRYSPFEAIQTLPVVPYNSLAADSPAER